MSFFAARDPYFEGRDQIRESLKNARAAFERWRALPDNAESSKAKADLLAELQNLIGDTRDLEEMCIDRVESDRHAYGIDQNEIVNRKQFVSNTLAAIDELKASLAVSKSKRSDLLPGPAGGAGRPMQQRAAQESPSPEDEARKMRMQMLEKREDEQLDEILRAGGRMHQIAVDIRDKAEEHGELIDDAQRGATEAHSRLKFLNKSLDKLLKDTSRGKLCTIGWLLLIIFVLFMLVIWT